MRPSAFSLQRKPTITQSAVRYGFTLTTPSRDPARYGDSSRLATTPSSPAWSRRSSHRSACLGSRSAGESRKRLALRSSSRLRLWSGSLCSGSPFQSRTSKATNSAGISPESLRIRLSAGWSRSCSRSNSRRPFWAMMISPSRADSSGRRAAGLLELREVPQKGSPVSAPESQAAADILEDAAEAVPLRLVLPVAGRQLVDELGLHGRERELARRHGCDNAISEGELEASRRSSPPRPETHPRGGGSDSAAAVRSRSVGSPGVRRFRRGLGLRRRASGGESARDLRRRLAHLRAGEARLARLLGLERGRPGRRRDEGGSDAPGRGRRASRRERGRSRRLFTCARTNGGEVECWGEGQSPHVVASGVAAIAAGGAHACGLTSAGAVECWGDNRYGQLGDGTKIRRASPVAVSGLSGGVIAVTAGGGHTCALTTAGAVKCWGENDYGQLGDGTNANRAVPAPVSGLTSGVTAIAAGGQHTCALTRRGAVRCWGRNLAGQLGDGTTKTRTRPTALSELARGVAAIAAGRNHTCALMRAGGVRCWGDNGSGQLGDGKKADRRLPTKVSRLARGVAAIAAGGSHTCALMNGGHVYCMGQNGHGQLGDGTREAASHPCRGGRLRRGCLHGAGRARKDLHGGEDGDGARRIAGLARSGESRHGRSETSSSP